MTDGPQEPQQTSASDRFKAIITSAESATYGLKENLLAVMTRDGSATWQTVAAHIEAQLSGAGEFAAARLNAILALIRTLSNGRSAERDDRHPPNATPRDTALLPHRIEPSE